MNQENKEPNPLGSEAGHGEAADGSSKDALNVAEKKMAVKKFCPLAENEAIPGYGAWCFENQCAWWVEGKCAIVKIIDLLATF